MKLRRFSPQLAGVAKCEKKILSRSCNNMQTYLLKNVQKILYFGLTFITFGMIKNEKRFCRHNSEFRSAIL